jgi:SPP1 gp7 family putative phage head morphogenesis protein
MILSLNLTRNELKKELSNFYQKYGKEGVVTYTEARKWVSEKDHRRRLTVLILFLHDSFQKTLSNISPTFEGMVKDIIGKETKFFDVEVDVDKVAFMEWGTDELNWLDRLDNDVSLWEYNIASDLKRSLLKRENIDKVLERMDKRFDSIERVINKLTLTESTAIGSLARREIFKELGVTKYRYYTMEDERTCEVCGALHGMTFPISAYEVGVTASPMHPYCRCFEIPIMN